MLSLESMKAGIFSVALEQTNKFHRMFYFDKTTGALEATQERGIGT